MQMQSASIPYHIMKSIWLTKNEGFVTIYVYFIQNSKYLGL